MGRAHDGAQIVLRKHTLERDAFRCVPFNGLIDRGVQCEKPVTQRRAGRSVDNKDVDKAHATPLAEVDNPHPTAGEAGIDRKNAHGRELLLLELGENFVADIEVAVDVLHVLAVLERFDDSEHFSRCLGINLNLEIRNELRIR